MLKACGWVHHELRQHAHAPGRVPDLANTTDLEMEQHKEGDRDHDDTLQGVPLNAL